MEYHPVDFISIILNLVELGAKTQQTAITTIDSFSGD